MSTRRSRLKGNQKTRQNMDPKETPQDQEPKCKDDGHKESAEGNQETRQDMDPKETPQYQAPKHKDDGHKEESPKGHKEEEPKDKSDGHQKEDRKPEKALLWLLKGEDPKPGTTRHWQFEGVLEKQKEPKGEGMVEQKEPKGKQQKKNTNMMK